MHTECFVKMLEAQKGEPKCSVCGAPYEDVGRRTKRIAQCVSPCGSVAMLVRCAIALLGCAINAATPMISHLALAYRHRTVARKLVDDIIGNTRQIDARFDDVDAGLIFCRRRLLECR